MQDTVKLGWHSPGLQAGGSSSISSQGPATLSALILIPRLRCVYAFQPTNLSLVKSFSDITFLEIQFGPALNVMPMVLFENSKK